jgi:23S rRNA pseudouridine1911/1915/1917 synthase
MKAREISKRKGTKEGTQHKPLLFTVAESSELMKFLLSKLVHKNRDNIKSYLRNRQVVVDGRIVSQFDHPLVPGQKVGISNERIPAEKQYRGFSIVFEDPHLIVIDKHAGILSMATDREKEKTAYSMLSAHLKQTNPSGKIFIVHRLDRDTSGLMVFAKSEKVQQILQQVWQTDVTERTYSAVIEGELKEKEGTVTSWLTESKSLMVYSSPVPGKGEKAVTHYRTIKTNDHYSLLAIDPVTGRKNQIRVHMKDLGHSIVGDKKYGSSVNPVGRMCLHARVLAFIHPITRENLRFETEIPRRFRRLV